jgi:hypothetical protein
VSAADSPATTDAENTTPSSENVALRATEDRFRLLVESVVDYGIFTPARSA